MTDTRKDPRAPVALKVRFKSKSVDEFAEQFSQDVSRGGLFIKSKDPMPIGTMLKFELQLSDETKIIAGVGRVVWRRDVLESAGDDAPAGMGIKFIKMDGDSRALVDRLVDDRSLSQPESIARFESGANAAAGVGTFFPAGPSAPMPAPEDRTQVRHARELLSAAFQEGGAVEAHALTELKAKETRERIARLSEAAREKSASPIALRGRRSSFPPTANSLRDLDLEPLELGDLPDLPGEPVSEDSEEPTVIHARRDPTLGYTDKSRDASKFGSTPPMARRKPFESRVPTEIGSGSEISAEPLALQAQRVQPPARKPEVLKPEVPSTPPMIAPIGGRLSIPVEPPERPAASIARPTGSKTVAVVFGVALIAAAALLVLWIAKYRSPETIAVTPTHETTLELPTAPIEPVPSAAQELPTEPAPQASAGVDISSTPPGAEIRVNGVVRGTTPLTLSLPVGVASEVALSHDGFVRVVQTITATDELAPIAVELAPLPWVIAVTSNPPGAQVRIGGRTGVTPARIEPPATTRPIPWSVLISLAGYLPTRVIVAPEAYIPGAEARVAAVDVVLTPLRARRENPGDGRHEPGWSGNDSSEPTGEGATVVAPPPPPESQPDPAPAAAAAEPPALNQVTESF